MFQRWWVWFHCSFFFMPSTLKLSYLYGSVSACSSGSKSQFISVYYKHKEGITILFELDIVHFLFFFFRELWIQSPSRQKNMSLEYYLRRYLCVYLLLPLYMWVCVSFFFSLYLPLLLFFYFSAKLASAHLETCVCTHVCAIVSVYLCDSAGVGWETYIGGEFMRH